MTARMGQISTLFVHKVVAAATAEDDDGGARRRSLFAMIGVDPNAPVDPKIMVPDDAYYALCERAAREDAHGPSLAIRVGASMTCNDYGAFGLAWKSALDLRRSYQRAERYARVLTSVSFYEVREEDGRHFMMLHREGPRTLGMRLSNEQTIVAVTEISREVFPSPFIPLAVSFKHAAPSDISGHERYFGCPVRFGADRDAVEVSAAHLATPNRLGDAGVSRFFDAHLERDVADLADAKALQRQVRLQIGEALSDGALGVGQIAERLGMSGRTLQRRLAEQECAFQDLVDEARRELAERLLGKTDYALAEVAFLTGFSEQSAFTRAFKRWSGRTPSQFRRETTLR